MELSTLLISVIAGLFIGIPTGPARFFVIDTCIKEGKTPALNVYGGLVVSKFIYAALALFANGFLSTNKTVESIIYLVASALLMVWGVVIIIKSNEKSDKSMHISGGPLFKKGFIVGISNPAIPFIYLTFVQLIKAYSDDLSSLEYVLNILTFETVSFFVLAFVSLLLLKGKRRILDHWKRIELLMGVFIMCLGIYQVYQQLDLSHGISLKSHDKSAIEKKIDEAEAEKRNTSELN